MKYTYIFIYYIPEALLSKVLENTPASKLKIKAYLFCEIMFQSAPGVRNISNKNMDHFYLLLQMYKYKVAWI